MTDIFGSSVNNRSFQAGCRIVYVIAGMNLPLLVEMVTQLDSLDTDKAKAAVEDRVRLFSFARRRTCLP